MISKVSSSPILLWDWDEMILFLASMRQRILICGPKLFSHESHSDSTLSHIWGSVWRALLPGRYTGKSGCFFRVNMPCPGDTGAFHSWGRCSSLSELLSFPGDEASPQSSEEWELPPPIMTGTGKNPQFWIYHNQQALLLISAAAAAAAAKSPQSCLTLSDPMDCSPPGSSVHGIFQARVLEWGAIAFSSFLLNVKCPQGLVPGPVLRVLGTRRNYICLWPREFAIQLRNNHVSFG